MVQRQRWLMLRMIKINCSETASDVPASPRSKGADPLENRTGPGSSARRIALISSNLEYSKKINTYFEKELRETQKKMGKSGGRFSGRSHGRRNGGRSFRPPSWRPDKGTGGLNAPLFARGAASGSHAPP